MGNWAPDVAPWFEWEHGLFRSTHFGTDGVLTDPGLELNVPDHLRCVNICLLAHRASGQACYLDLARIHAGKWADAILQVEVPPVALETDGAQYGFSANEEASYRTVAEQGLPDPASAVDRAENLLASNATGAFLALWQRTGEARFRQATECLLERIMDVERRG